MRNLILGLAVAGMSLVGANAYAAGKEFSFTIVNKSKYIISSFQVNEGDGWSNNALGGDQIDAGESSGIQFNHDGPCKIQVRVSWRTTDGGQEVGDPWNIDICDAKNVYFDGNKVTYD